MKQSTIIHGSPSFPYDGLTSCAKNYVYTVFKLKNLINLVFTTHSLRIIGTLLLSYLVIILCLSNAEYVNGKAHKRLGRGTISTVIKSKFK